MLIGDVGQGSWEEVSYQPASSAGGANYGWRCKEGFHDFNMSGDCPNLILTSPVVEYPQVITGEDNCSVIGGYVYRGGVYPWLNGVNLPRTSIARSPGSAKRSRLPIGRMRRGASEPGKS